MYHEFCGLYQIAKERYSLTYKVKYTVDDCILSIYRDKKLIIRVSEDEPERMYEKHLTLVSDVVGDDYYLKMMKAWYYATALAKNYDQTLIFLRKNTRIFPF